MLNGELYLLPQVRSLRIKQFNSTSTTVDSNLVTQRKYYCTIIVNIYIFKRSRTGSKVIVYICSGLLEDTYVQEPTRQSRRDHKQAQRPLIARIITTTYKRKKIVGGNPSPNPNPIPTSTTPGFNMAPTPTAVRQIQFRPPSPRPEVRFVQRL